MNNIQLQQLQTEEATRIRLNQTVNKLEHQVQHLTTVSWLVTGLLRLLCYTLNIYWMFVLLFSASHVQSNPCCSREALENSFLTRKTWEFILIIFQVLTSEREKHAATETELNMKNLGLADKLKEARGELTGMFNLSSFTGLSFVIT